MQNYLNVGFRVGIIGFLVALFLMFVSMGFPILNIFLAIPVGIATGKLIIRGEQNKGLAFKFVFKNALVAGSLTALGTMIPLFAIVFMSPKGATIGKEFSKWIAPNIIPQPLNSLSVAMSLGAIISTLVIVLLTIASCNLTVRWTKRNF